MRRKGASLYRKPDEKPKESKEAVMMIQNTVDALSTASLGVFWSPCVRYENVPRNTANEGYITHQHLTHSSFGLTNTNNGAKRNGCEYQFHSNPNCLLAAAKTTTVAKAVVHEDDETERKQYKLATIDKRR
jgi:hypothetical protein